MPETRERRGTMETDSRLLVFPTLGPKLQEKADYRSIQEDVKAPRKSGLVVCFLQL